MSIRKPLLGFSLFAVIALLLTYTIWSTLMRTGPRHTNDYTAVFSDSSGLAGGDDVRMAGVRVGRVESIKLENGRRGSTSPSTATNTSWRRRKRPSATRISSGSGTSS